MDLNKRAFEIVRSLTSEKSETQRSVANRNAGKRGGPARAQALSAERRKEIALHANRVRWNS